MCTLIIRVIGFIAALRDQMSAARTDEVDKRVGLEIGADDYMAKPFRRYHHHYNLKRYRRVSSS